MSDSSGFIAYPSSPSIIGETIEAAVKTLHDRSGLEGVTTWRETDIAGRFIATEILQEITQRTCFVADITRLNFNVTYEVGYAIGQRRKLILIRNSAITPYGPQINDVGIYDTLGLIATHIDQHSNQPGFLAVRTERYRLRRPGGTYECLLDEVEAVIGAGRQSTCEAIDPLMMGIEQCGDAVRRPLVDRDCESADNRLAAHTYPDVRGLRNDGPIGFACA